MATERCAPASERRGDPLHGTAPPAERFVLVEEPGAWGRNALAEWQRRHAAFVGLLGRCRRANARLLLIRRLHREPGTPRRFAVVDARPGLEATWWGRYGDDGELASLDPLRPEGEPSSAPTFLVCTHGRRDACCAKRGWPVVAALTEAHPGLTWQCSHVGGDRFAANLVALPHGLYYGHVTADSAVDVALAYLDGRVVEGAFRGRSCFPSAVQAAQHFARASFGFDAIDSVPPLGLEERDGSVEVRLDGGDGELRVVVEPHESAPIPRVTCAAPGASRVLVWELRELTSAH